MTAPLPLGRVVATPGALETILGAGGDPSAYVARHASGDWGDLCAFDRRENERSLRHGYRVLSSYPVGEGRVWVITEADRSATTILLPGELCGGGDLWIKTCLTPESSRVLVCDPCHGEHAAELTIVPGRLVVTARCDTCGIYGNPREFSGVRLGGRKGAYSGTCGACTEEEPHPAVVSIGQQTLDMGTLYSCLDNESSNLPRGS